MYKGYSSFPILPLSSKVACILSEPVFKTHACADLRTMSRRVESEQYYVTLEMFVADMKRMFNNARTYNSPDTIYYKCATRWVLCMSFVFSTRDMYVPGQQDGSWVAHGHTWFRAPIEASQILAIAKEHYKIWYKNYCLVYSQAKVSILPKLRRKCV